jgi:hypothetical protein
VLDARTDRVKQLPQRHANQFGMKPDKIVTAKPGQELVWPYGSRLWQHMSRSAARSVGQTASWVAGRAETRLLRRHLDLMPNPAPFKRGYVRYRADRGVVQEK